MPGFNPENINIHDLTIEEPEKETELPFDVERDISQETWEAMEHQLKTFKQEKDWYKYLWLGARMKVLNPDIDIHFDEEFSGVLREELKRCWKKDNEDYFSEEAFNMKIIDPQMDLRLDEEVWSKMVKMLQHYKLVIDIDKFFEQVVRLKVINPQFDLPQNENVDTAKAKNKDWARGHGWFWYAKNNAEMKITNPEADLSITQKEWQEMRKYLQSYLDNDRVSWWNYSTMAMSMKILAAEEVKVTDKGLEINMKKPDLSSDAPEVPEQRKF